MKDSVRILVFAKAPNPGFVKTRLQVMLGKRGAARIYSHMLRFTIQKFVNTDHYPIELWCAPDCKHPVFQSLARIYKVSRYRQSGQDLGYRMLYAIRDSLRRSESVILTGSDSPELPANFLKESAQQLQNGFDVVIGPAQDGGYALIGMKKPIPDLFINMPWGSQHVLRITRKKLDRLGLKYFELPVVGDVDTPDDVRQLKRSGIMATLLNHGVHIGI